MLAHPSLAGLEVGRVVRRDEKLGRRRLAQRKQMRLSIEDVLHGHS